MLPSARLLHEHTAGHPSGRQGYTLRAPGRHEAVLTACHPALFCLERGQGGGVIAVSLGTLGSEASGRERAVFPLTLYRIVLQLG
jgi:hypothetical protein